MDEFREWLSDNLRYFMLGGGILLVVLVLFFSIRACTRIRKGDSEEKQSIENESQGTVTSAPESEENTSSDGEEEEPFLEKNNEEIRSLLTEYYAALSENDITELKTLVDDLLPEDETRITNSNDFIEKYELGDVYSRQGLTEDSCVVFACYDFTCTDIDTPVPALAQLYVKKDSSGKWKVDGSAWEDSRISAYTAELKSDQEVQDLIKEVQKRNEEARTADPALSEFLDGLGKEVVASLGAEQEDSGSESSVMVTAVMCNLRAEPSTEAESLGILDEGTEVQVVGEEGEWKKVEYDGQTAYIRGDLLEES